MSVITGAASVALAAALLGTPSAVATPSVLGCTDSALQVSWTASYHGGAYVVDTAAIGGLQGCAGAEYAAAFSGPDEVQREVRGVVPDGQLVLELRSWGVPASWLDEVAVLIEVMPPGPGGGAPVQVPVAPIDDPKQPGAQTPSAPPTSGEDRTGGADRPMPQTGLTITWLIPIALALFYLGAWLRRRPREESN